MNILKKIFTKKREPFYYYTLLKHAQQLTEKNLLASYHEHDGGFIINHKNESFLYITDRSAIPQIARYELYLLPEDFSMHRLGRYNYYTIVSESQLIFQHHLIASDKMLPLLQKAIKKHL